ncbi:MAG: HAMP domain-containing protein, partial [Chloroflexi bacterium]|nr:HAMP domain-containing protein [Chloroflexota bacterium]
MNAFNNLKTGVKLVGGFLLVAAIIVVVAVLGYSDMKSLNDGMRGMYFESTLPIEDLGQADAAMYQLRGDVYKYILLPDEREKVLEAITEATRTANERVDKYRATYLVEEEVQGLAEFDLAWATYQSEVKALLAKVDAGDEQGAIEMLLSGGSASNARKAVAAAIDKLIEINVRVASETQKEGEANFATAVTTFVVVVLIGVAVAVGLGVFTTRGITVPLGKVGRVADAIAEGDLNQTLEVNSQDEIGQLADAFRRMTAYLQNVAGVADKIAGGD